MDGVVVAIAVNDPNILEFSEGFRTVQGRQSNSY